MLSKIINVLCILLLGFCAGVIALAVYYDKTNPSFWEFKLIDVISLTIYSVIGIYVAYHLKNRFTDLQMKKNLFLNVANDVERIIEQDLPFLSSFVKSDTNNDTDRIKVLLIIKKISNKIHILEEHGKVFNKTVSSYVANIRHECDEIKRTITDEDFGPHKSFPPESDNKVIRCSCNIILYLDQVKLSIFN
jgi:hypothetical protein